MVQVPMFTCVFSITLSALKAPIPLCENRGGGSMRNSIAFFGKSAQNVVLLVHLTSNTSDKLVAKPGSDRPGFFLRPHHPCDLVPSVGGMAAARMRRMGRLPPPGAHHDSAVGAHRHAYPFALSHSRTAAVTMSCTVRGSARVTMRSARARRIPCWMSGWARIDSIGSCDVFTSRASPVTSDLTR